MAFNIYLIFICVWVWLVHARMLCGGSVLAFYHVGPRDSSQVLRLDSKLPYWPSHPAGTSCRLMGGLRRPQGINQPVTQTWL